MAETVEGRRPVEGRARYDACPGHRAGIGMSPQSRAHGSELHGYPIPRRPITSDLRQEPGALAAHAGICAGGEEKSSFLPRPLRSRWATSASGRKAVIACCSCSGLLLTRCGREQVQHRFLSEYLYAMQLRDFSRHTPPSTTRSTSNAISSHVEHFGSFVLRRWRDGKT